MISAKIIEDSIYSGSRITTMQVRFHWFILPEVLTHRMFSRNTSSSRAIPVAKMIEQVSNDPAIPIYWGSNKPGMQAGDELQGMALSECKGEWVVAADNAINSATAMAERGLHKQITNRLLSPFLWTDMVITATEWDNFFNLRNHPAAQPEIQELAVKMFAAMQKSTPVELSEGQWHLPYVLPEERDLPSEILLKISTARCARVSYKKHDNTNASVDEDIELFNQLLTRPYTDKRGFVYSKHDPIHGSPAEHQATPIVRPYMTKGVTHFDMNDDAWSANFKKWAQYRQVLQQDILL